jgi:hypothetical protein
MLVFRDYECKCGCKYHGRHRSAETVKCPQCNEPMRMLYGKVGIVTSEGKRAMTEKDIVEGVYEKQIIRADERVHDGC